MHKDNSKIYHPIFFVRNMRSKAAITRGNKIKTSSHIIFQAYAIEYIDSAYPIEDIKTNGFFLLYILCKENAHVAADKDSFNIIINNIASAKSLCGKNINFQIIYMM